MSTPVIVFDKLTANADSVDAITVSGVPIGSDLRVVFVASDETVIKALGLTEAEVSVTFSEIGTYEIVITTPEYTDDEGELGRMVLHKKVEAV